MTARFDDGIVTRGRNWAGSVRLLDRCMTWPLRPMAGYSCRPASAATDRFASGTSRPDGRFIVSSEGVEQGESVVWLSCRTDGSRLPMVRSGRLPRVRRSVALRDGEGKGFSPWMPRSVVFTSDGERLISVSNRGGLRVWSAETGREVGMIAKSDLAVKSLALSPDGRFLAGGVETDMTIRLWHVASGREVMQLRGQKDQSYAWLSRPTVG